MGLRELVVAEVHGREAVLPEVVDDMLFVLRPRSLEAHVDARRLPADPVRELRNVPREDGLVQGEESAGALGDLHGDERLRSVRALRHEAEPVKVHVRTARDADEGLPRNAILAGILLHACDCQGAGGLEDDAGVDEVVLDRSADFVRGDQDDVVQRHFAQPEGLVADFAYGGAVGEQADRGELDDLPGIKGSLHRRCVDGLDAENLDARFDGLQEHAYAGGETAAADAAEHSVDRLAGRLGENLRADGPLACDDMGVVERVHEYAALLFNASDRRRIGRVVCVANEDDLGLCVDVGAHGAHLDFRRGLRHEDLRRDPQGPRRASHALRVVPR
mmetsp:Transcript_127654/g.367355  ORF Transcript_127654/g.367355 Transcript_127654/m.367355 type:complete len:333 (-) Transcript_127654:285-1283(-)